MQKVYYRVDRHIPIFPEILLKGIVKRVKSKHGSPRKRSKASKREF
jgi:hypothetical protein